ncbi:sodium transporter HKT1-like [Solanum dulcamara]|uniref:sodium transporter HKT1-like n=1 Tax=Solanum dulcamara TaxID=45834 RepID=UPI0024855488|nr:sodium transporter HKT1-like [Solanum dulcamara]
MPTKPLSLSFFKSMSLRVKPFWLELGYFMILSFLGFLALNYVSKPRTLPLFRPQNLDVFFTSVSSITVSSMSTVEMEVFSNVQLVFMAILMFLGGEAFTSFLRLQLFKKENKDDSFSSKDYELGNVIINPLEDSRDHDEIIKMKSIRLLSYVVFAYIFVLLLLGSSLVFLYITIIPSAKQILIEKGLNVNTFSIFITVSTFANGGFVPTNENMIVFKKNPGLLLILIPQVLLGNTLFAPCLRLAILFLWKITKRHEFVYILKNSKRVGYSHIFPSFETIAIAITVVGLIVVQFVVFYSLEWNSEATAGLSSYEKIVGSLFEVVNTRHTGLSVFDLSTLTPAILVLFTIMMYVSPYTTFLPVDNYEEKSEKMKMRKGGSLMEYISFSQPSCLVIFTILICVVEKDKMKYDPLNFNVLNIVFEVISAYGNVGMSIGYSCARQIKPDGHCKDATYGFAGKWSNTGKFILIILMFFGKMKKYNQLI